MPQDASPHQIAEAVEPVARRHRLQELYLFGSFASGSAQRDSDVDFIYQFRPEANDAESLWNFRRDLRKVLGRSVDLVKKDYIVNHKADPLAETQRVLFVNHITSHPMFRII